MKIVIAYVRSIKQDEVVERLRTMGVPGASLSEVDGFGLEADPDGQPSYGPEVSPYQRVVRLEVVCSNEAAENIAQNIATVAQTGRRGDGKVFILPVEQGIDVRSLTQIHSFDEPG